jgi:hypothetical protein
MHDRVRCAASLVQVMHARSEFCGCKPCSNRRVEPERMSFKRVVEGHGTIDWHGLRCKCCSLDMPRMGWVYKLWNACPSTLDKVVDQQLLGTIV